jgi:N-acylneuraminate cytidylyltransferase
MNTKEEKLSLNLVVVIPARAGSERFPGKNLALLSGQPLIEHSIDFALNQALRSEVYVSTNDPEVKHRCQTFPIQIIDRPDRLATSTTPTIAVLQHASEVIGDYDYMVVLQPTNPLRPSTLLNEVMQSMLEEEKESGFTVSPLKRKVGHIQDGQFRPQNYTFGQRSQDMESLCFENGLLYIASKQMIDRGELMNRESLPFLIDHPFASVDIDYPEDLQWAEHIKNHFG